MHAIVIPGHGRFEEDGCYRLSARCMAALQVASQLAERRPARVVVFSGWSPVSGPSEAEQMLEAWDGPDDIDLVAETSATITAENMSRSLPRVLERGVDEVTIVCGALHLPRVRYYFGGVYPRHGVRCSYALTRHLPTPGSLAWEVTAALLVRRQRRAALAEISAVAADNPALFRTGRATASASQTILKG